MKILEKYTKQEIEDLLKKSLSFRDFLIKIGSSYNGSASYGSIKKQLENMNIEIPKLKKINKERYDRKSNDEIFIENSRFSRWWLKDRIIKENLLEYVCCSCGNNGMWQDKVLILQLEHKNGINNDNRLDNLCFLCPNCHSQTDTFSGKKNKKEKTKKGHLTYKRQDKFCECGKKIHRTSQRCNECAMKKTRITNRPSYIDLIQDIEKLGYCGTGRKYGVSDNSIRKWIKNKKMDQMG